MRYVQILQLINIMEFFAADDAFILTLPVLWLLGIDPLPDFFDVHGLLLDQALRQLQGFLEVRLELEDERFIDAIQ